LLRWFDQARFANDDDVLERLWGQLDLPGTPSRGPAATRQVIAGLEKRLSDAGARRLLDADATLLGGDAAAIPRAAAAFRQVAAAEDADLEAAARVRLFALCAGALRAAADALGPDKAAVANRCLWVVSEHDPSAYFSSDPTARPSDPPWTELLARARSLVDAIDRGSAWRPIAAGYAEREATALRELGARMPPRIVLEGVPRVNGAAPYDRTPLLTVLPGVLTVDSLAVEEEDEQRAHDALREALAEDRRGRVTLLAHERTPWTLVAGAATLAAKAGAIFVDLGVASAIVVDGKPASRLGGIPVAAWTLRHAPPPQQPRDVPRGLMYDPARAQLGLTLVVDLQGSRIVGARGVLPGTAAEALRDVRRAFPEEAGLLVWAQDVTYGDVIGEIVAARVAFPALALAAGPPASAP
jgi:hypothetical protein